MPDNEPICEECGRPLWHHSYFKQGRPLVDCPPEDLVLTEPSVTARVVRYLGPALAAPERWQLLPVDDKPTAGRKRNQ